MLRPTTPNVFYEVGYAHGIKKATILLSDRTREKLPFDVSGFRTLFYDNTIGGKSDVEARLTTTPGKHYGLGKRCGSNSIGDPPLRTTHEPAQTF